MPGEALAGYAEALGVLKLIPLNGAALNKRNPDGPVRTLPFGRTGLLYYLILEDQRLVDVITVVWVG